MQKIINNNFLSPFIQVKKGVKKDVLIRATQW